MVAAVDHSADAEQHMVTISRTAVKCGQEGGRVTTLKKRENRNAFCSFLLQQMSFQMRGQRHYIGVRACMLVTNYPFCVDQRNKMHLK